MHLAKNPTTSEPKIHTPGTRRLSQNNSIFYKNSPRQCRFSCAIPTKQLQKYQGYRFYSKYVKRQQKLQHFCVTFTTRKFGRKTQNFSVKIFGRKAQNSVSTAKFAVFEGQITLKKSTKQWGFWEFWALSRFTWNRAAISIVSRETYNLSLIIWCFIHISTLKKNTELFQPHPSQKPRDFSAHRKKNWIAFRRRSSPQITFGL